MIQNILGIMAATLVCKRFFPRSVGKHTVSDVGTNGKKFFSAKQRNVIRHFETNFRHRSGIYTECLASRT